MRRAIEVAREIQQIDSKAARWIASDALRELTSDKVQQQLVRKTAHPHADCPTQTSWRASLPAFVRGGSIAMRTATNNVPCHSEYGGHREFATEMATNGALSS